MVLENTYLKIDCILIFPIFEYKIFADSKTFNRFLTMLLTDHLEFSNSQIKSVHTIQYSGNP